MNRYTQTPCFSTPATLWDGVRQLAGTLELWEDTLIFRLADFKESHLNLTIPLADIEKIEEYLVFNLAKNGLRIQGKNGMNDRFVLNEAGHFKKKLQQMIAKMNAG